ncbi:ABC transporter ATP-binding protein [Halothermothrix orenii]|uniref:ABC transporter related n=1 Tax=Halothermothrix orenii (strain H 168 / OCM 544 / DSM 9562) TaxID=373903 RepID=B8CY56_HALOH|nr:ABC transporter ATP-binding protein [Halothermothrix orenii]ACL70225.1 ABC transporter related [Halothermothrix orenii H 168]
MVRVEHLSFSYNHNGGQIKVLDNINLMIPEGTTCALIGPSGCGKTTLIYLLAGILNPDRGTIFIDGSPVRGQRRDVAIILQEYGLLPWKTTWNNIALGLKLRGVRSGEIEDRVDRILSELKLGDYKDCYPRQLSGGQRQRVAIGRALSLRPRLLLMDEPFSSLDALTREEIQDLFLKVWKKYSLTAFLVTHSIEEAVFLGQKIVVMSSPPGRIVTVIDNPHFAREDWRNDPSFYKQCGRLRALLKEGL